MKMQRLYPFCTHIDQGIQNPLVTSSGGIETPPGVPASGLMEPVHDYYPSPAPARSNI